MDEIVSGLWISDIASTRTEPTGRFDRIIGVCQNTAADNVGCEYEHYNIADSPVAAAQRGGSAEYSDFQDAADSVLAALESNETVLVHCHMGRNRSVTTSAAALGVYHDVRYDGALRMIEASRPQADPNTIMEGHARQFIRER